MSVGTAASRPTCRPPGTPRRAASPTPHTSPNGPHLTKQAATNTQTHPEHSSTPTPTRHHTKTGFRPPPTKKRAGSRLVPMPLTYEGEGDFG